jgi:hypothetical protein
MIEKGSASRLVWLSASAFALALPIFADCVFSRKISEGFGDSFSINVFVLFFLII